MIDLQKNTIPDNTQTIHLIGACGTGMAALACMLKDLGYTVTGSDQKVYPPMSDLLARKQIRVFDGFDKRNILFAPDLVVIGNAVTRDNPEVVQTAEMGLAFCSMPQAINRFIGKDKKPILITGTHGKTTTSSITAWLLYAAGLDPTFFIGGILKNFDSNYYLGSGEYMVIEGDEYDTAFFDKGPKFMHYNPALAVVTSIEFDHADIYQDLAHVKKAFGTFLSGLSEHSTLFALDADPNIKELTQHIRCHVRPYGKSADAVWQLENTSVSPPMLMFDVKKDGKHFASMKTPLPGEHNLFNALAAIAIADALNIEKQVISDALAEYKGVKRRQEIRGIKRNITVIDDFAHHPTAVRETVRAIKPFCSGGRLIAVFEPRTNSSMRNIFQDIYPHSFEHADVICIRKPPLLEKIPEGIRFSSEKLVDDLKALGKDAHYFPDTDAIIDYIAGTAAPGDTVLIMSNGGFDNIHQRILDKI